MKFVRKYLTPRRNFNSPLHKYKIYQAKNNLYARSRLFIFIVRKIPHQYNKDKVIPTSRAETAYRYACKRAHKTHRSYKYHAHFQIKQAQY